METRHVISVLDSLRSKSVFRNCPSFAAASSEGRVSLNVGETLVGGTFCIKVNTHESSSEPFKIRQMRAPSGMKSGSSRL